MSENIPESVPTSADRRSHRPIKKARALTPTSQQSAQVDALFANPDREISIPSGQKTKAVVAPPEIVANVQGSSAGAGSGEFHVYKASRRREYERLRAMDEEVEKEEQDRKFREKQEELRKADEEKLSKNQAKRAKARSRKEKVKKGGGGQEAMEVEADDKTNGTGVKKKFGGAATNVLPNRSEVEEDGGKETNGHVAAAEEGGGILFHDDE